MDDIYVSTDVETDGPIPGPNSMLSFGSAAFTLAPGGLLGRVDTFSANLDLLPGSTPDPSTKRDFWDKNPEAWAACRENPQPIGETMARYAEWLNSLPGKLVFVGYPATFDFSFIHWYLIRFTGSDPFGFSALDIKSYVAGYMGTDFRGTTKKNMPKRWFPKGRPHTHVALDDALEQGELFMNILREQRSR